MRLALVALFAAAVQAKTFFDEKFSDSKWNTRWVVAEDWKPEDQMGEWKWTAPAHSDDKGIKTGEDARFYSISAALDEEINNEKGTLILAFGVQHEQTLDCGGAYVKLLPPGFDQKEFGGDTDYSIMFGPDICGSSTRRTHAIFTYKGKNLLTTKNIKCETDNKPHFYALFVNDDNTYEVRIDNEKIESGSLFEDWDFLEPKMINDPDASKPSDWVDDKEIPDPEDVKPSGWDDIPAMIPDPEAEQPDDWDEEEDGEYEIPTIPNPEYKGEWKPKMITNPDYVGEWEHPQVENPDYVEDDTVYNVCKPCSHIGMELWQVKAGSIFDDMLVTDSVSTYEAAAKAWAVKAEEINEAKEAADAEAAAAAAAAAEEEEEDEDDEEDEDEHDEL